MNFFLLCCFCGLCHLHAFAQKEVPQQAMQQVYNEIKTPYKYGLVVVPGDAIKKIDCPSVFRKGNSWYMTYILFDGRGYETWLATSKDLLHWTTTGKLMSFTDTTQWDGQQKAGYIALADYHWGGSYQWQVFNQQYWMSYLGGNETGYEAGKLSIGIASSKTDPAVAHEWNRRDKPVLTATDAGSRWWEKNKLYKSTVIWDKQKTTGYPFVMYYNASGDSSRDTPALSAFERIGMAVSNDMVIWKRLGEDPVMDHRMGITGDAVIQKIKNVWVMFYFGAFWEGRNGAFNRFACSYDLIHWTDWNGDDLIRSSEDYDAKYAHKSFVVKYKGIVYHFYCATDDKDNRGIAVATSVDKGKSDTHFFKPVAQKNNQP